MKYIPMILSCIAFWAAVILGLWLVGCATPVASAPPAPPPPAQHAGPVKLCHDGKEGALRLHQVLSDGKASWVLCNGTEVVACPTAEGEPTSYAVWNREGLRCLIPQAKEVAE